MDTKSQKKRLTKIIRERHKDIGGYIESDTLFVEDQKTSLTPLLNIFSRIQESKEFTRLPPLFDVTENFPIDDMYVQLAVAESLELADPLRLTRGLSLADEQEARHKQSRARHVNLEECIDNEQHHNIVILGDPGSGKTSLLKYLCLEIAKGNNDRWLFPIFISLRQYWLEKKKYPALTLLHYAAATLQSQKRAGNISPNFSLLMREGDESYKLYKDNIEALENILSYISSTDRKHVLFLLDGLDEIASSDDAIEIVSGEIRQLGLGFSWILTSRFTGYYSNLGDDIRYEVVSLHNEAIVNLVSNWFKHSRHPNFIEKTELILTQIWNNPRLLDMARNPFLLTLLCYVQNFNEQKLLPLQRNDIYKEIIDLIRKQLRSSKNNDTLLGKNELIYLGKFCHYLYTEVENAPLQLFEQDHWEECTFPQTPPDLKKHFQDSRLLNSWKKQGDYHFVHLTFQEYFIAQHLSGLDFELITEHLHNPQWRVVYRFLAGVFGGKTDKKNLYRLITYMLNPVDKMGLLYIEASILLIEAGFEDSSYILDYDLRDKLWNIWLTDKTYLMNSAGETLAMLSPNYVIKKHLEALKNQEERSLKKSIQLLGLINLQEADELLFDLYLSSPPKLLDTVIQALADKNSEQVKSKISDLFSQNRKKWFVKFCLFAKASKNKELIPNLLQFLQEKPKDFTKYEYLFKAFTAIGDVSIDGQLLRFIEQYSLESLSDSLIECFVSLNTQTVKNWIKYVFEVNDTCESKSRIRLHACKYNRLSQHIFIKLLKNKDEQLQRKYIETITFQIRNSLQPSNIIIEVLVGIMLSGKKNAEVAFNALLEINPKGIIHGQIDGKFLKEYRGFLTSKNEYTALSAVMILAEATDIQSFKSILGFATSIKQDMSVRIESIRALANYYQLNNSLIINTLHTIYEDETKQKDRYLANIVLETLAKIDVNELSKYINNSENRDVLTKICTTENILLFGDYYYDKFGVKYNWDAGAEFPILDVSKEVNDQQIEQLRVVCQYLIDQGYAKKTGKESLKPPPLFKKQSYTHDEQIDSIDANTGNRLLKGMYIHPYKAQKLIDRIENKFPKFTKK